MGIFSDNPILTREVRARLRLRRLAASPALRWGAGAGGCVIVYFYIRGLIAIGRGQLPDARELWSYLLLFLLLLIVIIAPALLSTAITQEREQQTWESLATTQLTAAEVLCGKWLARLSLTGLPVLVLLPFLIGCAVRGEVAARTNVAVLLFLVVTAGSYGAMGLLCSFFARKTVAATVASLTVTLFLCLGIPILASLLQNFVRAASWDDRYHDPALLWLNPFYALFALVNSLEPQGVGMITPSDSATPGPAITVYLVVSIAAAAAALLFMASRYRRISRE